MPRQKRVPVESHVVRQPFAHIGKQRLKHGPHGQNRRPDIHRACHRRCRAHLAARPFGHLDDVHIRALRSKTQRSRKPADTSSDDNHLGQSFTLQVSAYVDTSS